MKLYLSSYQFGNNPEQLGELVGGKKRVGVIRNALDFSSDQKRLEEGKVQEFLGLRGLGLNPEAVDLRQYFGSQKELLTQISELDALWVVGGNTFILRKAMAQSGLDRILIEKHRQDHDFVYAGYSAGICLLAPTLKGIDLVDQPEVVPEGYLPPVIWDGLNILPFSFAPHYRSEHPESEMVEKTVQYFINNKIPFIALSDGEVYTARQ